MKIRQGFVSNSSSSSFTIYGQHFDDYNELVDSLNISADDVSNYNLKIQRGENADVYIGKSFFDIGNDETPNDFKFKIKTSLMEVLKVPPSCGMYEESWYNG